MEAMIALSTPCGEGVLKERGFVRIPTAKKKTQELKIEALSKVLRLGLCRTRTKKYKEERVDEGRSKLCDQVGKMVHP